MKYTLTILISLICLSSGLSQSRSEREQRKAQLDALKVQFFTEELDLTEKESEAFWPVFYQFEKQQKTIKRSIKQKVKALEGAELSEEVLLKKLLEIEQLETQLAQNKTKLIQDCIPILGLEKATALVSLEDKLRKRIADRIKGRMER
ncbi:MAG: hypothetical protein AB8B53_00395 [Flavobacteriales bacterium]